MLSSVHHSLVSTILQTDQIMALNLSLLTFILYGLLISAYAVISLSLCRMLATYLFTLSFFFFSKVEDYP